MFREFHGRTGAARQFCELSLLQCYANLDEDYNIWVVKFAFLSSFNLFHVNEAQNMLPFTQ